MEGRAARGRARRQRALEAVVLDPAAAADPTATAWTLCHTPKPPSENRVAAVDCLAPAAPPDAVGDPVSIAMPTDVCRVFGPDVPQPLPGQPTTRARDADATGGYFQPVTVAVGGALAIGLERVTCDLPEASLADSRAWKAAYQANQNPTLVGLSFAASDGSPIDPAARSPRVPRSRSRRPGSAAPSRPSRCSTGSRARLSTRAETLTASWYVTGGALDQPAAAITDTAALSTATNWTAPAGTATVELALILRDSRGGSDIARATLAIADP